MIRGRAMLAGLLLATLPVAPASAAPQAAQHLAYGSGPLETLDFYPAPGGATAPLIVFIHGGGWKRGDKDNATGRAKIGWAETHGYAFATIDYPLVPQASVEAQAADVARAVAYLLRDAGKLGVDPSRVVLMGHSAGAHLAALVGTDPRYLSDAGVDVRKLAGVVLLDGAAYDVPAQLNDGPGIMQGTYAQAFGSDPVRQRALSPTFQAAAPNAPAFLILHIDRADGRRQSQALAAALKSAGTEVEIDEVPGRGLIGHMQINRRFGEADQPATGLADVWLTKRLAH